MIKPLILLTLFSSISLSTLSAEMTEKKGWEMEARIVASIHEPKFPDRKFLLTDFGAVEG